MNQKSGRSQFIRFFAFAVLAVLALSALYTVYQNRQAGSDLSLQPHRALYNLRMTALRNATAIANVNGQMFYEWHESCDRWTTNQKFQMDFLYPEGDPARLNSTYTTSESRDGHDFDFSTRRERNGVLAEEVRGQAGPKSSFGIGALRFAHFTKPNDQGFDLPSGAKFPSAHTAAIIAAAKRGVKFMNLPLFDGSELGPAVDVSIVIKKDKDPELANNLKDDPLLKKDVYRVRMAFFSNNKEKKPASAAEKSTELPDYEMTLWLHEDGIVSQYQIDYPEFSLIASLDALDAIEKECP